MFKRLEESVAGVKRDAEVSLSFEIDEQQLVVISGKANIEVDLECQRCNEVFAHECEVEFTYTPYLGRKSEEDAPDEYDLVDLNEFGEVDLVQLVEDEFILNLPQVAMHDEADCSVDSDNLVFGELPEEVFGREAESIRCFKKLEEVIR